MTPDPAPPTSPPLIPRRISVESVGYYYADSAPGGPAPLLIGLHGYGQTGEGFLGVLRKLVPQGFSLAAAQGFNQIWDPATRKISFSWLTAYEKRDSVERNHRFIQRVIDEMTGEGSADPKAVFLLGFSQGSSVAYRFAQENPGKVCGMISICADLPPDVESNLAPLHGLPVFLAYGLRDQLFPEAKSLHAVAALRAGGVEVEPVSFDRGHLIPSSLGPRIQDWAARALESRRWRGSAIAR